MNIQNIKAIKFDYVNENGRTYSANIIEYALIYYSKTEKLAYLCLDFDYTDRIATFMNMENASIIYDYANHSELNHYSKIEVQVDILADVIEDIDSNGVIIALDYLNK